MKLIRQRRINECGVSCIKMITTLPYRYIRKHLNKHPSFYDISMFLKDHNYPCICLHVSSLLTFDFKYVIAHLSNHYVILTKDKFIYVYDPIGIKIKLNKYYLKRLDNNVIKIL